MFTIKHFVGSAIPDECRYLTLPYGLMGVWLNAAKDQMEASVGYDFDLPITWCTFLPFDYQYPNDDARSRRNDLFNIAVYTHHNHRQGGVGRAVLKHALQHLASKHPGARIRYGSTDCPSFNSVFQIEIERVGLFPERYW